MSESASVDTPASPTQTNGSGLYTFHGRIADLLDDVTVSAQPVATAEETLDELFAGAAPPPAATFAEDAAPPHTLPPSLVVDAAAAAGTVSPKPQPDAYRTMPTVAHADRLPVAATDEDTAAPPHTLPPSFIMGAAAVASAASPEPQPDAYRTTPTVTAAMALPTAATAEETAAPRALPPSLVAGAAAASAASPEPQQSEAHRATADAAGMDTLSPTPPPVAVPPVAAPPATAPAAATTMAGVDFPAWVPPWDESQRLPATQPAAAPLPPTADVGPAQAAPAPPQPERSIFAPLALPGAPASAAVEEGAHKPSADLPPFLAAAAIVARQDPAVPATPPASAAPVAGSDVAAAAVSAAVAEPAATVAADAEPEEPETTAAPGAAALVSIRGRMDGLAIEVGNGSWPDVVAALSARLSQSASFFREAKVALNLGQRALTEAELDTITALLRQSGMTLALVRTGAERTFQSALALGLTVTLEAADGAAMAEAAAATSNAGASGYFVYRGYLRSGNRLRRKEHVLVIGDVNPGAEVISDGDVLVWGRLRGIVHAGAGGNVRAIVAALDMEPTQLRIADVVTTSPDPEPGQPGKWFWQRSANKRPEVARLIHKAITFEEWDAGRPGGLVSLRRGG